MAKGKTNQPLTIDVYQEWIGHPAVAALRDAGHTIRAYGTPVGQPNWIMHPAAGWHDEFFAQNDKGEYPFVQARLKAERARKKVGK